MAKRGGQSLEFFSDAHSFLENTMAELSRIKTTLENNEAHHHVIFDKMRKDLSNEAAESRESANQFRYEFDNLVHARCQAVAEGLQAMENNQRYAHNTQQKALNNLEGEVRGMRRSLCHVNDTWASFKAKNDKRPPLCKNRANLPFRKKRENAIAEIRKIQAHKTAFVLHELVESMRTRIKSAAEGLHGKQWSKVIKMVDQDGSGQIEYDEFKLMIVKTLKCEEPDSHIRVVFDSLDEDHSGSISCDELIEFVADPVVRMKARIRNASRNMPGGFGLEDMMRKQDKDDSGQISLREFKLMCRKQLNMLDRDEHLHQVFNAVDLDKSGEVSIEEFLAWMKS